MTFSNHSSCRGALYKVPVQIDILEVRLTSGKVLCPFQGVVTKSIRAPNSSSGASVQQSVGSNPGRDSCVPKQDTCT